jgi:superfamily I DNA and/or RNA helicase
MGAVDWACARPNILNVAVTRSKENLYIVGDKFIWGEKPFFKTALKICNDEYKV